MLQEVNLNEKTCSVCFRRQGSYLEYQGYSTSVVSQGRYSCAPLWRGGGEVTTFAHEAAIMVDICENGVATVGTNGVRVPCGR